jgi:hypothetical protein
LTTHSLWRPDNLTRVAALVSRERQQTKVCCRFLAERP